jgi:hypothetical protein
MEGGSGKSARGEIPGWYVPQNGSDGQLSISRSQSRLYNLRPVEGTAPPVNAVDAIANPHVQVLIAFSGRLVVALGGDREPFALRETDEPEHFSSRLDVPQSHPLAITRSNP